MNSKRISLLILSITLVLSITLIFVSFGLSKRAVNTELITFTGDLEGSQEIAGCCLNAGPNPVYTMTLSDKFPPEFRGERTGYIFMNSFGHNMPWEYKFQFWWDEDGTEYFIEIRGGEVHRDRKTKIVSVTFDMVETYEIWIGYELQDSVTVTFNITRDPHHPSIK
jgi:hypothetical protein